jgi:hypothetical protein
MKDINKIYFDKFLHSMKNDYMDWNMTHCAGADWSWTEYRSPNYTNENGNLSFGFALCNNGAWVNGMFKWKLPLLNIFSKSFWKFRKAKLKMIKHLKNKEKTAYLKELNSVI